ncbi:putative phage tail protein [Sphingomonas sp. CJ99]
MVVNQPLAQQAMLMALLPSGAAWPRDPGSVLGRLLLAFGDEFWRVETRIEQLRDEFDPRTAYELLGDWERALGLPDGCTAAATSTAARQLACWRKLAFAAGHSRAFYLGLAAALGYEIEIFEFDPFVDAYDASLTGQIDGGRYRYVWRVSVINAGSVSYFRAGDPAGGLLLEGDAQIDLECIIAAAKPAHTHVVFSYPEEGLPTPAEPPAIADVTGVEVPFGAATPIDVSAFITGSWTGVLAGNGARGTTAEAGSIITYTPGLNQTGADSFTWAATGPGGTSNTATVSLVIGAAPAPVASDLSGVVTPFETPIPIHLAPQISGVCTSIDVADAMFGTVEMSGNYAIYTPNPGYAGGDTFTFTAIGPGGTSNTASVSLTVSAPVSPGSGGGGGELGPT